tara:strand:- start:1317 stop:1958 length:642 start_codon:yes stop_codon:yes gene_type:complete
MVLFVLLGLAIQICGYVNPIKVQEQVFEPDTNVTPLKINLQLDTGHVRIGKKIMLDKKQMKSIINNVLQKLGEKYATSDAVEFVYNTGLVESKYIYLKQIKGPAKGLFQCEAHNCIDIIKNYLSYRPELMKIVAKACNVDWKYFTDPQEKSWEYILTTNIAAQIVFCRLHYRRVPERLPKTLEDQARQWKKYYNTAKGRGTELHFLEVVKKYG